MFLAMMANQLVPRTWLSSVQFWSETNKPLNE
uniref:Uncharacterized protein n=1 Tax=Myoviridae sp. ctk251 TaxID=2826689 RepID=A0A8S5MSZ0_9CAUD|nr:MAG TPA: Protein of unknown function (DUF3228) [Myoviridae sp. ctk251]